MLSLSSTGEKCCDWLAMSARGTGGGDGSKPSQRVLILISLLGTFRTRRVPWSSSHDQSLAQFLQYIKESNKVYWIKWTHKQMVLPCLLLPSPPLAWRKWLFSKRSLIIETCQGGLELDRPVWPGTAGWRRGSGRRVVKEGEPEESMRVGCGGSPCKACGTQPEIWQTVSDIITKWLS